MSSMTSNSRFVFESHWTILVLLINVRIYWMTNVAVLLKLSC